MHEHEFRPERSEFFDKAKSVLQKGLGKARKAFDENWPVIVKAFREHVTPVLLEKLRDDKEMARIAGEVYKSLPGPFRFVVAQDAFVAWCLRNRDRIITALQSATQS